MADISCRQAELLEADVEMHRASEADRMRIEVHLQRCESCAERSERVRALADALRKEPIEARVPDRALVASALMEAHDRPARTLAPGPAMPWLAAAAAIVAVGSAAWWMATRDAAPTVVERDVPDETAPAPVSLAGLATPCEAVVTDASTDARAFLVEAHDRVCRIRLDAGELRLSVEPNAGVDLVVATPTANVKVVGTVFSVGVEDGFTSVVVYRGTVEVRRERETLRVTGGHRMELADDREALVESASDEALEPLVELEERAAASQTHDTEGEVRAEGAGGPRISRMESATENEAGAAETIEGEELAAAQRPAPARRARAETPSSREPEETSEPAPIEAAAEEPTDEEPTDGAVVAEARRLLAEGHHAQARTLALTRTGEQRHTRRLGELYTVIAESYVGERDFRHAYVWYERVQQVSRGTVTGANALIAAANLALEHLGRPEDAVRLYTKYIEEFPRGTLHEDAYDGRCRSLWAAGRRADAQSCARAYVTAFRTGRHRDRMRQLLGDP